MHRKIVKIWHTLRLTNGLLFIAVGADKFFDGMTVWQQYISPLVLLRLPISSLAFIQLFGVVQIIAGCLLFTRWLLYGIVAEFLLLFVIFLNLLTMSNSVMVSVHAIFLMILLFLFYKINHVVLDFDQKLKV